MASWGTPLGTIRDMGKKGQLEDNKQKATKRSENWK